MKQEFPHLKRTSIEPKISELILDKDNYRITDSTVKTQDQIFTWMLADDEKGLKKLMKDIVAKGLSPLVNITVIHDENGKYLVIEGNRRIACLKMLLSPDHAKNTSTHKVITDILKTHKAPDTVGVTLVEGTRKDLNYFVALHHNGYQEGKGLKDWARGGKSKLAKDITGKGNYPEAENLLEQLGYSDPHNATNLTTLQRFLVTKDVAKMLGYKKIKHEITNINDGAKVVLAKLAEEITQKKLKGNAASYDKKKIVKKIKKIAKETGVNLDEIGKDTPKAKLSKAGNKKSSDRDFLIDEYNKLPDVSDLRKINDIINELRKLKVSDFVFAVALLFRTLIENSVDVYMQKEKLPTPGNDSLCNKLVNAIKYIEKKGGYENFLRKKDLGVLRDAFQHNKAAVSITDLNSFVHSQAFPDEKALKTQYLNIEPLLALFLTK